MHLSDVYCIGRADEECDGCTRRLTPADAMGLASAHIITPPERIKLRNGFVACPERVHAPNVRSETELRAPTVRGGKPTLAGVAE